MRAIFFFSSSLFPGLPGKKKERVNSNIHTHTHTKISCQDTFIIDTDDLHFFKKKCIIIFFSKGLLHHFQIKREEPTPPQKKKSTVRYEKSQCFSPNKNYRLVQGRCAFLHRVGPPPAGMAERTSAAIRRGLKNEMERKMEKKKVKVQY